MKVLVTGARGFIGKHLVNKLNYLGFEVLSYDIDSFENDLINYIKECDFICHLAGINRPLTVDEFYNGNTNFTKKLIDLIKENNRKIPIIFTSSIQAALDNDYGKSKKMGEDFLFNSDLPVYVYRLNNVYGKWCRPNYNSAAATFCYNIANNLAIEIRDRNYVVHYNFVGDIVDEFIKVINSYKDNNPIKDSKEILSIPVMDDCSLGHLADLLYYFKKCVESDTHLPEIHNSFELKLFKTFLDYLSDDGYTFNYAEDQRGSFEELYKSKKYGQISENISYPGIIKGGHYHTYKKEIFYTVEGKCVIKQRNISTNEMLVDEVNGNIPHPVDIKINYTHSIENVGKNNSVTLMWISEIYNPNTHDTYKSEVE